MAEAAAQQPAAHQARAAGNLHANRSASKRAKTPKQPPKLPADASASITDPMDQMRTMLDRFFAGNIASLAGIPIALVLLIVRGLATLKATASLPTRHLRFTETNWIKMLPSAKKMRPFTFTQSAGIAAAFGAILILLIIQLIQILPFIFLTLGITGVLKTYLF